MQKANWQNEGSDVNLTMPISKVDVEKRQVFGWASLDNIDSQRDKVDAIASREAFAAFRGNIREQHDEKKAVGKLVDFREDTYFDESEQKFYQGIYVTAYVSKGAQDTWEKVMDGTLSGFSIGGSVLEAENAINDDGTPYRKVTKYGLTELSLVDNPANQKASVVGFAKVAGTKEEVLTGDLAAITVENVFVCNKCLDLGHGIHKSSEESFACPMCASEMIKIGFVESSDPEPKETIKKMVNTYRLEEREGGVQETMAEENVIVTETVEVEEVVQPETEEATEEAATEEVVTEDQVVEVEEVADPLTEAVNSLRELTDRIEAGANARHEELRKSVTDLDTRFDERLSTLATQVQALEGRQNEFTEKFAGIDASVEEVRNGLTDLDGANAIKKSAGFDQPTEEVNSKSGSFWKGSFITLD